MWLKLCAFKHTSELTKVPLQKWELEIMHHCNLRCRNPCLVDVWHVAAIHRKIPGQICGFLTQCCNPQKSWTFVTMLQSTEKLDFWHIAAVQRKIPWPNLWIFVTMLQSTEKLDFWHIAAVQRKSWGAKSLQTHDGSQVEQTNQVEMIKVDHNLLFKPLWFLFTMAPWLYCTLSSWSAHRLPPIFFPHFPFAISAVTLCCYHLGPAVITRHFWWLITFGTFKGISRSSKKPWLSPTFQGLQFDQSQNLSPNLVAGFQTLAIQDPMFQESNWPKVTVRLISLSMLWTIKIFPFGSRAQKNLDLSTKTNLGLTYPTRNPKFWWNQFKRVQPLATMSGV